MVLFCSCCYVILAIFSKEFINNYVKEKYTEFCLEIYKNKLLINADLLSEIVNSHEKKI